MKNAFEVRGDVTEIILPRRNGERTVTLIDTVDLERVDAFPGTWYLRVKRDSPRYVNGQLWSEGCPITRSMIHRLITSAPLGMVVDHKNHDVLDNRRENLRIVSTSVNMLNRLGNDANNTTGFRGVWRSKRNQKFRAAVMVTGSRRHLGMFDTADDAARAVRAALIEIDPVAANHYPAIPESVGAA